jgi:hypothetical protein
VGDKCPCAGEPQAGDAGTPLAKVGIRGGTLDRLTSAHWDGQDIKTVEELVSRWPRHEVAKMDGIGRKTLEKIDAAIEGSERFEQAWTGEVA